MCVCVSSNKTQRDGDSGQHVQLLTVQIGVKFRYLVWTVTLSELKQSRK